eukprot:12461896-Alexandrium_andersonii.AAC.1
MGDARWQQPGTSAPATSAPLPTPRAPQPSPTPSPPQRQTRSSREVRHATLADHRLRALLWLLAALGSSIGAGWSWQRGAWQHSLMLVSSAI